MSQKHKITQYALGLISPEYDEKLYQKSLHLWWTNIRTKPTGGLRLTTLGWESLNRAEIKSYEIEYTSPVHMTNQLIIWLDQFIDCPYYLAKNSIFVYTEKMAVQLVLFSNDIYRFTASKAESLKRNLTSVEG